MKIAIVFREKTIPGGGNFDHHFYILDEYYKMAIENGIELLHTCVKHLHLVDQVR